MKVEDNLLAITNCMFKDKGNWKFVTQEQKETYFFIINRLLSKKFPDLAQLLNTKSTDKASALDCWFLLFFDKPYPSWIWSKKEKTKTQEDYSEVLKEYDINEKDLELLKVIAPELLKEEIKYLNKQK